VDAIDAAMTTTRDETFRIDVFGRYGVLMLAMWTPVFWSVWPRYPEILGVAGSLAAFLALAALAPSVTVTDAGIVLLRVNSARWQDIKSVRRTWVLGLPYLSVVRVKGLRWWLPLYLRREPQLRAALISRAPIGHPLRAYAEGKL
jgi:hypothetical protein